MVSRYNPAWLTWKGEEFTDEWPDDGAFDRAFVKWQGAMGLDASGVYGQGSWLKARNCRIPAANNPSRAGQYAMDLYGQALVRKEYEANKPRVPQLGPVWVGGVSLLRQDLTHMTSGKLLGEYNTYPALDDAFWRGTNIIAPEPLTVTQQSSADYGDAFYATGVSTMKYWFGHLERAPITGAKFAKGAYIGRVGPHPRPHVHVGIDARPLIGSVLQHHTNYTHGAPLVGVQLYEALQL